MVRLTTTKSIDDPTTTGQIVRPTVGHLLVVLSCTIAGFALGSRSLIPDPLSQFQVTSYLLLTLPYFLNYNSLYENRNPAFFHTNALDVSPWLRTLSKEVPILLTLLFVLSTAAMSSVLFSANVLSIDSAEQASVRLLSAILPYYALAAWVTRQWPNKNNGRVFWFRYRTLFPALITCAMSFTFGWSLSSSPLPVLAASGLILILASISTRDRDRPLFLTTVGSLLLLALLLLQLFYEQLDRKLLDILHVFTFAFLMALIMIIAEAWRVTARIRAGACYVPLKSGQELNTAVLNHVSGTNIATCLFPPLFLVTVLHPSTNWLYAIVVTLVVFAQFVLWFWGRATWRYQVWNSAGLFVGFTIPWVVVFGTQVGDVLSGPGFLQSSASTSVALGVGLATLTAHGFALIAIKKREPNWSQTGDMKPFILLVGVVSAFLCIAMGFLGMISWSVASSTPQRVGYLKLLYLFLIVLTTIGYLVLLFVERNREAVSSQT